MLHTCGEGQSECPLSRFQRLQAFAFQLSSSASIVEKSSESDELRFEGDKVPSQDWQNDGLSASTFANLATVSTTKAQKKRPNL